MNPRANKLGHLELSQRFNDLHQLLYTRGGIRPSNAAVEELTKLLLLRIASERDPDLSVTRYGSLATIIDPDTMWKCSDVQPTKDAFALVNSLPDLSGRLPGGGIQPIWPVDEPLRISRADVLAEAMSILNLIPIGAGETLDPLGTAFDSFLRGKYEHAGGLGTYLTPHSVVQAMTAVGFDLINPFANWRGKSPVMGDPCCGSGRFLVAMVEHARRVGLAGSRSLHDALVGADQSPAAIAMARVNLLAYGLPPAEVFTVEDSITDMEVGRLRGQLRMILTNPPFGEGKYDSVTGISRASTVITGLVNKPRIDPALAFVALCIDLLAPDGVAGIVLPDGVLDSSYLRQLFLGGSISSSQVQLEGILSLPTATFAPAGTMAKTSVLFLRKATKRRTRVFLARADHVGHVMRRGIASPDPQGDDLPRLAEVLTSHTGRRWVSSTNDGHALWLERRALTALDASSIDADAVAARNELLTSGGAPFEAILQPVGRRRRGKVSDEPFVSVLHVDELGNVDWLQAEHYRPTTPGQTAKAEELIISLLNPAKFRATVIPAEYSQVQCSIEFGVFKTIVDPYAVLALLQHRLVRIQIAPMGRGTSSSRRRIDSADILQLVAPPYDHDWLRKTGREVADALAIVAAARVKLQNAYGSS